MYEVNYAPPYQIEDGWLFETKEKAENFLKDAGFLKITESQWITRPTRGSSKWPKVMSITRRMI